MNTLKHVVLILDNECITTECDDNKLEENVRILRLCALKLLTFFCCKTKYGNVRWGNKWYSSCGNVSSLDRCRTKDVSLESFEEFENELTTKFQRIKETRFAQNHFLECKADVYESVGKTENSHLTSVPNPNGSSKLLSKALNEVLHDFDWNVPNITSPIKRPRRCKSTENKMCEVSNNFVFLFSKCPQTLRELSKFLSNADESRPMVVSSILEEFLPSILLQYYRRANISVFWIDTSVLSINNQEMKVELDESIYRLMKDALESVRGTVIPISHLVQCSLETCRTFPQTIWKRKEQFTDLLLPVTSILNSYVGQRSGSGSTDRNTTQILFPVDEETNFIDIKLFPSVSYGSNEGSAGIYECLCAVGTIPRNPDVFRKLVRDSFVCLPCANSSQDFVSLLKSLLEQNLGLLLADVNSTGLVSGILLPVNDSIANFLCFAAEVSIDFHKMEFQRTLEGELDDSTSVKNFIREKVQQLFIERNHAVKKLTGISSNGCIKDAKQDVPKFVVGIMENWCKSRDTETLHLHGDRRVDGKWQKFVDALSDEYKHTRANKVSTSHQHASCVAPRNSPKLLKSNGEDLKMSKKVIQVDGEANDSISCNQVSSHQFGVIVESASDCKSSTDETENVSDIIQNLKTFYESTLNDGTYLHTCAQNILTIVKHHFQVDGREVKQFLDDNLLLNSKQIAAKYDGGTSRRKVRIREHQLQILLRMELENLGKSPDGADHVVLLLRTMSFLSDPATLSSFMTETIFNNYLASLQDFIVEICDELNHPLPPGVVSPGSVRDDSDADVMLSPRMNSSIQSLSSVNSNASSCSRINTEDNKSRMLRKRSFRNPSFVAHTRQIVIRKALNDAKNKQMKKSKTFGDETEIEKKVRRSLFTSGHVKLNRRNTTDGIDIDVANNCRTPSKVKKTTDKRNEHSVTTPRNRLRHVLKTKFVPETPEHKQGSQAILRKQQRLRLWKTSLSDDESIVEESPDKSVCFAVRNVVDSTSGVWANSSYSEDKSSGILKVETSSVSNGPEPNISQPKTSCLKLADRSEDLGAVYGTPSPQSRDSGYRLRSTPVRRSVSRRLLSTPRKAAVSARATCRGNGCDSASAEVDASSDLMPTTKNCESSRSPKKTRTNESASKTRRDSPISSVSNNNLGSTTRSAKKIKLASTPIKVAEEFLTSKRPVHPDTPQMENKVRFEDPENGKEIVGAVDSGGEQMFDFNSPEKFNVDIAGLIDALDRTPGKKSEQVAIPNRLESSPNEHPKTTKPSSIISRRITRNVTRLIGVSPEGVRHMSTLTPPSVDSVRTDKRKSSDAFTTPSRKRLSFGGDVTKSNAMRTSPSALSLLHLTSSPMMTPRNIASNNCQ